MVCPCCSGFRTNQMSLMHVAGGGSFVLTTNFLTCLTCSGDDQNEALSLIQQYETRAKQDLWLLR